MAHIIYGYQFQNFFHLLMVSDSDGKKIGKHLVSVLFGFWTLSIIVKTHT